MSIVIVQIVEYPFLEAYRRGDLLDMWGSQTKEILDADDGKLSQVRAGEIAAAIISIHFMLEYELLEEQVRAQDFTDERIALYDWLADNQGIHGDLQQISGTRTLLWDEHDYIELKRLNS